MNNKENMLKTIYFDRPDYIPIKVHINAACWYQYNQDDLCELMDTHKFLFPDFTYPPKNYKPIVGKRADKYTPFIDDFGCVWETLVHGITGAVIKHPLANWDEFADYEPPNPMTHIGNGEVHWDEFFDEIRIIKEKNENLAVGGLIHGHTFLRLCDIRGYQNLLFDMVDEEPNLNKLIHLIEDFNYKIIQQFVKAGCEMICYAEDLGMQIGPMLSPQYFKKYIKPSYKRIMQPAKDANAIIHMHSDGDIRMLIDDIIDSGVQVQNLQDNCNKIEWIEKNLKGKICIDLDIDRQFVTTQGTPKEIDDFIRKEISMLGSKEGGLSLVYGLYPGIEIPKIKALFDALEKYAFYFN